MITLFGTTLRETAAALGRTTLGYEPSNATGDDRTIAIARIVISFLLLCAGLFFIARGTGNQTAMGNSMVSGIIGYWLR